MMHIFHEVANCVPPGLKGQNSQPNITDEIGNIKMPNNQNRPHSDLQMLFSHPLPPISVRHKFLI